MSEQYAIMKTRKLKELGWPANILIETDLISIYIALDITDDSEIENDIKNVFIDEKAFSIIYDRYHGYMPIKAIAEKYGKTPYSVKRSLWCCANHIRDRLAKQKLNAAYTSFGSYTTTYRCREWLRRVFASELEKCDTNLTNACDEINKTDDLNRTRYALYELYKDLLRYKTLLTSLLDSVAERL